MTRLVIPAKAGIHVSWSSQCQRRYGFPVRPAPDSIRGRARQGLFALALLLTACVGALPPAKDEMPADGRHEGRMCVATRDQPPNCGSVQLLWFRGRLQVDVGDISYLLWLKDRQLDLVLQHGATQVDAFEAAYSWHGSSLHFEDAARSVRYELCFGGNCRLNSAQ